MLNTYNLQGISDRTGLSREAITEEFESGRLEKFLWSQCHPPKKLHMLVKV